MSSKGTFVLTAVLVVLVIVAFVTTRSRESATSAAEQELFLPRLAEHINDVASVTIQGQDETFTLVRSGGGWAMQEKDGYPADGTKVRGYLLGLASAERLEKKTADPARYDQLGLEDVDAEGSSSARVTVADASGAELASLVVGKTRVAQGGQGGPFYYAREAGDATSWLVEGDLRVDKTGKAWLDQTILEVGRERVVAARIEHADGDVVSCTKTDPDAQYPELEEIPEGQEPTYPGITARFTSALERLRLDDVRKDGSVEFPDPPQATAVFWTDDGLKITVRTAEIEEKLYCRFEAAYDEAGAPGTDEMGPPPPPAGDETAEGEGAEGASAEDEPAKKSPEEVRIEADQIRERVSGWTYVLPTYRKSTFMARMSELVRDIPPPPEETPAIEVPGDPGPGATAPTGPGATAPTGPGATAPTGEPGATAPTGEGGVTAPTGESGAAKPAADPATDPPGETPPPKSEETGGTETGGGEPPKPGGGGR